MRAAYVYIIWQILECCKCHITVVTWAQGRTSALGHHAYISGNALVPMLQLFNVP